MQQHAHVHARSSREHRPTSPPSASPPTSPSHTRAMPELSKLTPEQLRAVRTRLAVTACCSWAFFLGVLYVLAAWLFAGSGGGGSGGGGDGGHHHSGGGAFWSLARRGGYGAADALAAYTFEQDVGGSGLEAGELSADRAARASIGPWWHWRVRHCGDCVRSRPSPS